MSNATMKAARLAMYVQRYIKEEGGVRGTLHGEITMTDATEAIWGTSGRGNPSAVRLIEATATLGYLAIRSVGKRKRLVRRTDKPIPDEALSAEDREWLAR